MSLEFVVGLYDFQAQNPTELSFKANERLQILYHPPDDPMWWMARNDRGFSGLVPVNYVKVVSDNAFQPTTNLFDSNVFSGKEWFFGRVSRKDAEDLLSQRGEVGDFLIRNSETQSGELSLSVKGSSRVLHFRIRVDERGGNFTIGNHHFSSMEQLLGSYRLSPIFYEPETNVNLCLIKPFPRNIEPFY